MRETTVRATEPGSALLEAVAVMDRLRSPGGCPWDAEQTHASLRRYLVEETYEVLDAVDALDGGPASEADLAEELGDVLLQVLFHARVAAERGAFDVDDVAAVLTAKLRRRHPHVFGDAAGEPDAEAAGGTAGETGRPRTDEAVQARWDELKAAEKPSRGPVDGIPRHLPALARADKLLARLQRADMPVPDLPPSAQPSGRPTDGAPDRAAEAFGARLFALASEAREAGVDPEAALRAHVARVESAAASGTGPAH